MSGFTELEELEFVCRKCWWWWWWWWWSMYEEGHNILGMSSSSMHLLHREARSVLATLSSVYIVKVVQCWFPALTLVFSPRFSFVNIVFLKKISRLSSVLFVFAFVYIYMMMIIIIWSTATNQPFHSFYLDHIITHGCI